MRIKILTVLACSLLAACGGGSGNSSPVGSPPTSQPVTYSAHIAFQGGDTLATKTMSLAMYPTTVTHVMDTTGSLPIEMAVPADSSSHFSLNSSQSQGIATVVVAPQPSAIPAPAYSTSGVSVTVAPMPQQSPAGSTPAPPRASVSASTSSAVGSGAFTASVGAPVNQTPSVPIYLVRRSNLACGPKPIYANTIGTTSSTVPGDQWGGIAFTNGVAQQATSTSTADLYLSGSACTVTGFSSSESGVTLHAPFGAVWQSSLTAPFATLSATAWSNSLTSETVAATIAGATSPTTPLDILLIKTADGHVVKVALNDLADATSSQDATVNFSYEVHGYSVDGF